MVAVLDRFLRRAFSADVVDQLLASEPLLARLPEARWELDKPGVWRAYLKRGNRHVRVRVFRERGKWTWNVDRVVRHGHLTSLAVGIGRTRGQAKATGFWVAKLYAAGVASW